MPGDPIDEEPARPSEWDEYAATWDEGEAARAYAQAAFDSLESVLRDRGALLGGARVCDFGCGTGLLTERLADTCELVDAVDTSSAMLDVLRETVERQGWTHVRPSTRLRGQAASYDLIVCSSVCGFVEDYPRTVKQLVSLLRPGGLLVQWDWELDDAAADPPGLSRSAIEKALTSAGLISVQVEHGFVVSVEGQAMSPLMGVGEAPDADRMPARADTLVPDVEADDGDPGHRTHPSR